MEVDSPRAHCDRLEAAGAFRERIQEAREHWAEDARLGAERRWLDEALAVAPDPERFSALLDRAARLPELSSQRSRHLEALQVAWVESIERLQAEIAEREGPRAPVLEAIFGQRKLPSKRAARQAEALTQLAELDRRLTSAYVTRVFEPPEYEWARERIEAVRRAGTEWQTACDAPPLAEDEAEAIRAELAEAARSLEQPMRQARLLIEAALVPIPGAFEETGLKAIGTSRKAPRKS